MLLFVDESGDGDLVRLGSSKYFVVESRFRTSSYKKLKTQDSKTNNLLQLADMVVGSIARSNSGKQRESSSIKMQAMDQGPSPARG